MKTILKKVTVVAVMTLIMSMILTACSKDEPDYDYDEDYETEYESDDISDDDINTDIDFEALNESVENIKNLDLGTDVKVKDKDDLDSEADDEPSDEPKGEKTVYSYADVYRDGNSLTVIPNGGLNSFTVLYSDKDLDGLLDYIDSTVLEEGRTINRDMFYKLLSTMLVDKDLASSDNDYIEKNMIMALAMANNFHDTPVDIKECHLDANNAADYVYKVNVYGKDDTWIVNYANRTVFWNDGATEYSSDMFKDEYLAYWWMAVDDYYGIKR